LKISKAKFQQLLLFRQSQTVVKVGPKSRGGLNLCSGSGSCQTVFFSLSTCFNLPCMKVLVSYREK
jgi:hypothetical protein